MKKQFIIIALFAGLALSVTGFEKQGVWWEHHEKDNKYLWLTDDHHGDTCKIKVSSDYAYCMDDLGMHASAGNCNSGGKLHIFMLHAWFDNIAKNGLYQLKVSGRHWYYGRETPFTKETWIKRKFKSKVVEVPFDDLGQFIYKIDIENAAKDKLSANLYVMPLDPKCDYTYVTHFKEHNDIDIVDGIAKEKTKRVEGKLLETIKNV